jgi:alpha-glucosidase (family GH31 glycosyl hydrolase)
MREMKSFRNNLLFNILIFVLISPFLMFCQADEITGNVRVQVLSPTLVRIELKGPQGFEDRPTFHIPERNWPGAAVTRSSSGGFEWIQTSAFIVKVPSAAASLNDIVITDLGGAVIWSMPSDAGMTIKCRWADQGEAYLFDNGNQLGYGTSPVDNHYYWIVESANGYTQIKNKATGDYINLENNLSYVECTPVQSHWDSKDWTLEDAGSGYRRLLCRWPIVRDYIHIENLEGYAEHDPAGTSNGNTTINNWWSAMWMIEGSSSALFSNNRIWIPNPNENTQAWAIADTPRYVPASSTEPWGGGYNIAPQGTVNNGWNLDNDSRDVYIFLPQGDGRKLRSDYVALTGRTDLIPLHALGGWDSRYYPYTQQEALDKIDTYRSKNIPLDVFVVDTDWRVGASHGYGVNTTLFPDMTQFISDAHNKNVRIVFNDHPEPQGNVLDYVEVQYRNNGLRSLFDIGLDTWWYDRNWHTAILPPVGINKEVFGMYLYHWITRDYYPNRRPLIMANIDGIDNGYLNRAPDMAAHRYNMQWTGDTTCDDASLQREVRNAVYTGVYAPFAYVSTDLGGHNGTPTTEQYCRWVQFGALSPIFRLHCTAGVTRDPWVYADPAEEVVRDYVQMRMRLLPVFYAASRENYDTGEPILKRCDLNYPGYPDAQSDYQYLLGDDILVAPVMTSTSEAVSSNWLENGGGLPGLSGQYFSNKTLSGSPVLTRTDVNVDFNWDNNGPGGSVPIDNFSTRWTGTITIRAGYNVNLGLASDDGCRLWINNVLVVDKWIDQAEAAHWTTATYNDGQTYSIKIEYYEGTGKAVCRLLAKQSGPNGPTTQRQLWIPPGAWTNVWTGDIVNGPQLYTTSVSLTEMPIFVKQASIIPLAPDMEYTGEKIWTPITLDVYPSTSQAATADLYEDDGVSNDYKSGSYRNTTFEASANDTTKTVSVTIDPAQGTYPAALSDRSWVLRLRTPAGWPNSPQFVMVDGTSTSFEVIPTDQNVMPFAVTGGSPDGDVIEVQIPSTPVSMERTIVVYYCSPADYDMDGDVDLADFRVIIDSWLEQPGDPEYDSRANLDHDPLGKVNLSDCVIFCREWTGQ